MNTLIILSRYTALNIMFMMLPAKFVAYNILDSQRSNVLVVAS
jgi:hypothetical protein